MGAELAAFAFEKIASRLFCVCESMREIKRLNWLSVTENLTYRKEKWYYFPSLEALKFWLSFNKALKCVLTLKNESMLLT